MNDDVEDVVVLSLELVEVEDDVRDVEVAEVIVLVVDIVDDDVDVLVLVIEVVERVDVDDELVDAVRVVVVVNDVIVLVVVVTLVVVVVVSVVVHCVLSTWAVRIGLYPLEPLERSTALSPNTSTAVDSGTLYRKGAFSSPDMNFASTPPALCTTTCATEMPTDTGESSLPSSRAVQTVMPSAPAWHAARTSTPKLPLADVVRCPTATRVPSSACCIQLFSDATSKYSARRDGSTGPFPFEYTFALMFVAQPLLSASSCSTRTKMPRLTLLRKLASFPDTSVLWSASSADRLCSEPARMLCTVGPSPPAKFIPR